MTTFPPHTDPRGLCFISYRRCRADDIALVVEALHEHGIPTWKDQPDLPHGPTEPALRAVLADPATACTLLWLTPEVLDSDIIKRVESRLSVERARHDSGFFLVAVAAGGLDYDGAAKILRGELGTDDLADWNLYRLDGQPPTATAVASLAERVLRQRLRLIDSFLPASDPLRIQLAVRRPPLSTSDDALRVDWSHHFGGGRLCPAPTWQDRLLPALATIRETLRSHAPGRSLEFYGPSTLSAAVAWGAAFSSRDPAFEVGWRQPTLDGGEPLLWNSLAPPMPTPFRIDVKPRSPQATALAVVASVVDDASGAFSQTSDLPDFRAVVEVGGVRPKSFDLVAPGQGTEIVRRLVASIRQARQEYAPIDAVHLFLVTPQWMAMLLGRELNTLGRVVVWEHDEWSGTYRPSLELEGGR